MLLLLACVKTTTPDLSMSQPTDPVPDSDAVAGIVDPELRRLLADHWEATMRRSPTWATRLGDHRFDDRIGDNSAQAHAASLAESEAFLARAIALETQGEDALSRELFISTLTRSITEEKVCASWTWTVSAGRNPVAAFNELGDLHDLDTAKGKADYRARLGHIPGWIDHEIANLRTGLAAGWVGNAESIRRVLAMLDTELASPPTDRALIAASPEVADLVLETIDPALGRYRNLLTDELLPVALPDGLTHLPGGAACYEARILQHTSLPLDPAVIHQTGLDELQRIHAEMAVLGERLFGITDVADLGAHLRGSPELHFSTREEVEDKARESVDRAAKAVPSVLANPPEEPCDVKSVPDFRAPYTYIAYYEPVSEIGGGTYWVNSWEPTSRPRWDAEVLAFHEAIPGHHTQFATALGLPAVPAFRRHAYETAYAEGWALYSERLADELGLYSSDLDRLGMLSFDSWRASRLVVDTGIHHQGWTRDQAIAFMAANTLLAENNIDNEVDRYIGWPGQALAYKLGQLEVLALRAQAEDELGEVFTLQGFHTAVLEEGPLPLDVLRRRVEAWIERVR
ncbi:MAG: DUF885 domain-containing protein [Proteobacteria bacterium]|nr:DUF885 domain-containing protein [Pseudomonadota bacterium]